MRATVWVVWCTICRRPIGAASSKRFAGAWVCSNHSRAARVIVRKATVTDPPRWKVRDGVCRGCGCTDEYGCDEGCAWVEPDLCSSCALT